MYYRPLVRKVNCDRYRPGKDVTKFTVSETGDPETDFGHAACFLSGDAEGLAA